MYKLLSLLSVLIITAIPTLITASPYQQQEKLNKDFNLKTIKKENGNEPIIVNNYKNGKFTNYINNLKQNDSPITYYVGYSNHRNMWANWSSNVYYSDYKSSYLVVDYSNYAQTFNEFVEKYPSVTIDTSGEAVSTSTFGDVGKNKFGTLNFDTATFNNDNYRYINFVDAEDRKSAAYSIRVTIGLGFKKTGSRLYLNPFIDGSLDSVGAYTRYLNFGLSVSSITFNPKINKLN